METIQVNKASCQTLQAALAWTRRATAGLRAVEQPALTFAAPGGRLRLAAGARQAPGWRVDGPKTARGLRGLTNREAVLDLALRLCLARKGAA